MSADDLPRGKLLFATRRTTRRLIARIRGLEHIIDTGTILNDRERAILSDALMSFMHAVAGSPRNDGADLPEYQVLLERLMSLPDDFPAPRSPATRRPAVRPWNPPAGTDPRR
jgi:hypothetical protein